jgi:flagellar hook-associated protein 3 FlgL
MRVSNQLMADSIKANLYKQARQLFKTQEHIATGKRINRPSDDPIGIGQVLGYRKRLASMKQYTENITNAKLHIDTTERILESVTTFLAEAKKIAADPNPEMRDSFAQQVTTIREQILQMANSQINGTYIFAGDRTDTQPFDSAGFYAGDTGSKDFSIGENLQIDLVADGSRVFQGASDLFTVLTQLHTALQAGDTGAITDQIIPLSDAIEQIKIVRVENAGRYKRLEATEQHYAHFKVNVEDLLSGTEDADMAEAIIDLKVQQIAYESTLATSAKIINRSLIDFLS